MKYYKYINDVLTEFVAEWEIVKYQDHILVTNIVAELLEEVGFTNPNMGRHVPMYNKTDHSISSEKLGYQGNTWRLAPTQAQAYSFILNDKKLLLCVSPIFMDETRTTSKYFFYLLGQDHEEEEETYYDSYEEAMEYGLFFTLKYLKNEK